MLRLFQISPRLNLTLTEADVLEQLPALQGWQETRSSRDWDAAWRAYRRQTRHEGLQR